MKKNGWLICIIVALLFLASCSKNESEEITSSSSNRVKEETIQKTVEKKDDVINNMIIGNSKISFNNTSFDEMSEGKFSQNELWGTFRNENKKDITIQLDAFDNTQTMYGDISGYELDGIDWQEEEAVQYLMVMEEAIQFSNDDKALMYKARTGDIIFSVAMFSDKKLTDENILALKSLAKGITIDYAEGKVDNT